MWDVGILLNYFRQHKSDKDLTLKDLSLKLGALLLSTSAQRIQTIHLICISWITFTKQGVSIQIRGKLKHTRPGKNQAALNFSPYIDNKLCVVNCLQEYIAKIENIRNGQDKLFLTYAKPHRPASKDTISRWMKMVLSDTGIKDFSPHSFRGASATAMVRSGLTIEDMLKKAGWSSESTFKKFYYRCESSVQKDSEGHKVGQMVL